MSAKAVDFFDFRGAPAQQADAPRPRAHADPVCGFLDALDSAGYGRPEIHASGAIERFDVPGDRAGSKNGWYVYHGDGIPAGSFGSWKTGESLVWCAKALNELSPQEREANRRRVDEAKAKRDEELSKSRTLAAERAAFLWDEATPTDSHPYLTRKGVPSHGLRVDKHGNLIIPIMDRTGKIHTLQFINPDAKKEKLYLTKGAKKGNAFWIPGDPGKPIYVAEGYATAASVHAATGATVFVAFDSNNLGAVGVEVRAMAPTARIIFAADNDAWTEVKGVLKNVGILAAQEAAKEVGGSVCIPSFKDVSSKPTDFNDLFQAEGLDVVTSQLTAGIALPQQRPLEITSWGLEEFDGGAPERKWLIEGVLPLSTPAILASMGDAGKGMLTLDLGLKVAGGDASIFDFSGSRGWWGHDVATQGQAVIITAEDDRAEMHRRLVGMDPKGTRREAARGNLFIVPLPNYGGPLPLVTMGKDGPQASETWWRLRDGLAKFQNLKLINLDPLSSFIMADLNADPMVGSFTMGLFASLATDTGATILLAHHMRKPSGKDGRHITSPAAMRDAVRGTTALVDGVRCLLGLASEEDNKARKVCKKLGEDWKPGKVFRGAVCKSNGPADRGMPTFVRNASGLLVCRDAELQGLSQENDILGILETDISKAAKNGRPYTKTGKTGVYERREELSAELQDIGKHTLQNYIDELLRVGAIVSPNYKGRVAAFLDVPGGEFAMGTRKIESGYQE